MNKLKLDKKTFDEYLANGIIVEKDDKFFTKVGDEVICDGRKPKPKAKPKEEK